VGIGLPLEGDGGQLVAALEGEQLVPTSMRLEKSLGLRTSRSPDTCRLDA
jgi:hypothetical protein